MNTSFILPNPWSILEERFDENQVKAAESLFSLGNGAMGQRANFEEQYTGESFQGSYIAGVYYPDKTRVGWWKNGYPAYFAKVLNAPNWIGIDVLVDGVQLDLYTCLRVEDFRRELNMQEGWLRREFTATLANQAKVAVCVTRFLSLDLDELGAISYEIVPLHGDATIRFIPYLDAGIKNEDSNWDDEFWKVNSVAQEGDSAFIDAHTHKTAFHTCTYMRSQCFLNERKLSLQPEVVQSEQKISFAYEQQVPKGQAFVIEKFGGYTVDRNHPANELKEAAKVNLDKAVAIGFTALLTLQKKAWSAIWKTADITITGDVKAQQGIRYTIFQLNQTYAGNDPRLNIGPKGFTGEKYGGSTYWDTEAFCLPFYMATKSQDVARNLLTYRYQHLKKAIENAEKLGFNNGAALYPMVTMNGEECHNEWEITFEEIHRNGAIAFAIYNYVRYTGDRSYLQEKGMEVLIGIARFWNQRATFSTAKDRYVILGVTGPNEYENNVNNNWYTNYLAQWCLGYTLTQLAELKTENPSAYNQIITKTQLQPEECEAWDQVKTHMYFPYDPSRDIYLQQDGFLDKEIEAVSALNPSERPINQHWSWDRILRSPYIKQADVLQGLYFFEDHFDADFIARHFDFYEPLTVHESSLSPCVHAIIAAKLNRIDQAYAFYLQTARLDLDDYNKEVEEGLHITSMAGTWLSIVEGFGGMRIIAGELSFTPQIPSNWESYSFKINFRNRVVTVIVHQNETQFELEGEQGLTILVHGKRVALSPKNLVKL